MAQVKCQGHPEGPQGRFPTGICDMSPWVNWTGCVIRMGSIGRPKSSLGKWGRGNVACARRHYSSQEPLGKPVWGGI